MLLFCFVCVFFFQAEDGIRDRSPSRGLGDVYKRQVNQGASEISIMLGIQPDLADQAVKAIYHNIFTA